MKELFVICLTIVSGLPLAKTQAPPQNSDSLTGYLITGSTCLNTAGTSIATPTDLTEASLAASCIKLIVAQFLGDWYKLRKFDSGTEFLFLSDGAAPTYTDDGSVIQFSNGADFLEPSIDGTRILTDSDNPIIIQNWGVFPTNASCLTASPTYMASDCGYVRWYFIEACQVEDCDVCNADVTKCDTCSSSTIPNTDSTACEACSGGKVVNADKTACVDCTVTSCTSCSDNDVCVTCSGTLMPNDDGSECVEAETTTKTTTETTTESKAGGKNCSVVAILGLVLLKFL